MAVTAVLFFAAVLELVGGERFHGADPVFWSFAMLFLMFCLNSILVAHFPGLSVYELVKIAKMAALLFVVLHFVRTSGDLRGLALVMFAGAVATVVFGLANIQLGFYTDEDVIGYARVFRFSGAHEDPNNAAGIMCSTLPLGMFMALHPRGRWMRPAVIAGMALLVIAIFATFSRAAIFAFTVVAVTIIAREIRTRQGYLAVGGLLVALILLTPGYYWNRIAEMQRVMSSNIHQDFSLSTRLSAMKAAWELIRDHPWTGIGLGNFLERNDFLVFRRVVAHNTPLEILVGVGVLGATTYAGMLLTGFGRAMAGAVHTWSTASPVMRSFSFYLALSIASILVSSVFLSIPFDYTLWIPVAAGLVLGRVMRQESQPMS
jgi:O-antigen ligase